MPPSPSIVVACARRFQIALAPFSTGWHVASCQRTARSASRLRRAWIVDRDVAVRSAGVRPIKMTVAGRSRRLNRLVQVGIGLLERANARPISRRCRPSRAGVVAGSRLSSQVSSLVSLVVFAMLALRENPYRRGLRDRRPRARCLTYGVPARVPQSRRPRLGLPIGWPRRGDAGREAASGCQ